MEWCSSGPGDGQKAGRGGMGTWPSGWGSAEKEGWLSELATETQGRGAARPGRGCWWLLSSIWMAVRQGRGLWRGLDLLLSGRGVESRLEDRGGN